MAEQATDKKTETKTETGEPVPAVLALVDESPAARQLTAEEQMVLFEKALKEEDWGHQPC